MHVPRKADKQAENHEQCILNDHQTDYKSYTTRD